MTDKNFKPAAKKTTKKAPWSFLNNVDGVDITYALWDTHFRTLKDLGDYSESVLQHTNLDPDNLQILAFESDRDNRTAFFNRTFDIEILLRYIDHVTCGKVDPIPFIERAILRFMGLDAKGDITTFDEYRAKSKLIDYAKLEKLGRDYIHALKVPGIIKVLLDHYIHHHRLDIDDEVKVIVVKDFGYNILALPASEVRETRYKGNMLHRMIMEAIVDSFLEKYDNTAQEIQNLLYRLYDVNVLNGQHTLFVPYSLDSFEFKNELVDIFKARMKDKELAFVLKDKVANVTLGDLKYYKELRKRGVNLGTEASKALVQIASVWCSKAEDSIETIKEEMREMYLNGITKKHSRKVSFLKHTQLATENYYFNSLVSDYGIPTIVLPVTLAPFAEECIIGSDYQPLLEMLDCCRRYVKAKQLIIDVINQAYSTLFINVCDRNRSNSLSKMTYEDAAILHASTFFDISNYHARDKAELNLYKKESEIPKFPVSTVIDGHVDTLMKFLKKK